MVCLLVLQHHELHTPLPVSARRVFDTSSIGSSIKTPGTASSQTESVSVPLSGSQPESSNDSQPIEVEDGMDNVIDVDVEEDADDVGSKRKLTSTVWNEFKRVKYMGVIKAKCKHCSKNLSGSTTNGTSHLHDHLKRCTLKKIKMMGKNLAQPHLRFGATTAGTTSIENYCFDQEVARKALATMIILHEYPLSMVDHTGFRSFCSALQPMFKVVTRNTMRKDILNEYEFEKKKAIEYMAGIKSRVAVTTDMWTSNNQKRGYMAITAHFIDESWTLRSIIMRFIYVPAPHTSEVIADELYDSLVEWNLDEKICEIRMKIRQWSTCGNIMVEAMSANMIAKFDKYWSDIQGLMGIATILDPRFKCLMLLMCFEWLLGTTGDVCDIKVAEVKNLLSQLMIEYRMEEDEEENECESSATAGISHTDFFIIF